MKSFLAKFAHLFSNVGHDVHVIFMVLDHLFKHDEIVAAINYVSQASVAYATHEFENAQTRSFVSNSLMKMGMSQNFSQLLTAKVMTLAEHWGLDKLQQLHDHLINEANASPAPVVAIN